MHVLFVAPEFPAYQRQFVRALKAAGARVTGIGERPVEWLDDDLRSWMDGYVKVSSVCHEGELLAAVRRCQAAGWVDRLETTVEAHIMPVAKVREAATIPGLSVRAAWLCRDKPAMKAFLREHGVPCAQSSSTCRPRRRPISSRAGMSAICPPRCTGRIARVLGVTLRYTSAGSMQ